MTLAEILAELAKHKPADIVASLPRGDGTLFQAVFQQGFDHRHAKAETDEAKLKADLKAATEAQKTAEGELAEFRKNPGKAPEVAELTEKHKAEIRELEGRHKADMEKVGQAMEQERRTVQLATLQTLLTSPPEELRENLGGKALVPAYARILTQDQDLAKRIRFGKDGSLELYGEDGKTPLVGKDGKPSLGLLAQELVKKADSAFVLVNGQPGSGLNGDSAGGGTGSFYEQLRKDETGKAPAPQQDQGQQNVPATAAGRMHIQSPAF